MDNRNNFNFIEFETTHNFLCVVQKFRKIKFFLEKLPVRP